MPQRLLSLSLLVATLFVGGPAALADTPGAPPYPRAVGEAVNAGNHAHWPVRVRKLERIRWRFGEGKYAGMPLPGAEGLVYIQAGGGAIRAVDPASGKRRWLGPGSFGHWNYSSCAIGPDQTAYHGNFNRLFAVGPKGKARWTADLDARWFPRAPAVSPNGKLVYVGGDAVGIAALDAVTGRVRWMRRDFQGSWLSLCFDNQQRLLVARMAQIDCFGANGALAWSLPVSSTDLLVAGRRMYSVARGKRGGASSRLVAHNLPALHGKPQRLWERDLKSQIRGLALGSDGRVRVACGNGELCCVEAASGTVRWRSRISKHALARPATALDGETLVSDRNGVLYHCDRQGDVLTQIATGLPAWEWRPTVLPDGRVLVNRKQHVLCIDGPKRTAPAPLIASELFIVADDFVVDIWRNGKKVPMAWRTLVYETHGASTERVTLDLRAGDAVVFHVVANRLRWNGASYFAVHARDDEGRGAFESAPDGTWYFPTTPRESRGFLASRASAWSKRRRPPRMRGVAVKSSARIFRGPRSVGDAAAYEFSLTIWVAGA